MANCQAGMFLAYISPRERVEERTWEYTLDLPGTFKASRPRKTKTARNPRQKSMQGTSAGKPKQPAKPTSAQVVPKQGAKLKHALKSSTTLDRKEQNRLHAQDNRQKARELGRCRDCPDPAIPDQTRCERCAEKHRVSRRRWQAGGRGTDRKT